jgi:hypothetical protein
MDKKIYQQAWKEQLQIALENTIRNEIINASGDGVAKPSQYLDKCVASILEQISISETQIVRMLIDLTDKIGYKEEHLEDFNKVTDFISDFGISIDHKYY